MSPFTSYSDLHKLFLQTILSHKKIQYFKAFTIFTEIAKSQEIFEVTKNDLNAVILLINKNISDFNLAIKEVHCEVKQKNYLVLICTVGSPLTQIQNIYNEKEIEFLRKIIHEIILSRESYLPMTDCINLSIEIDKFGTLTTAEKTIVRFIEDDWLNEKNKQGDLTLSVRAVAELHGYLSEFYRDYIKFCDLCHNITLHGKRHFGCQCIFHTNCIENYQRRVLNGTCPKCIESQSQLQTKKKKKSS